MSIAIGTILYAAGVMTGIVLICIVQTRHWYDKITDYQRLMVCRLWSSVVYTGRSQKETTGWDRRQFRSVGEGLPKIWKYWRFRAFSTRIEIAFLEFLGYTISAEDRWAIDKEDDRGKGREREIPVFCRIEIRLAEKRAGMLSFCFGGNYENQGTA